MVMTICSEGDVITPEHAYADILNTVVMGITTRVKPLSRKLLVFPGYGNYHTTPSFFVESLNRCVRCKQMYGLMYKKN